MSAQAAAEPRRQLPCPPSRDYCVEAGDETPAEPGSPGGSTGSGPDRCTSVPFGGPETGDGIGLGLPNDPGPRPAPDSVLLYVACEGETTGRVVWWTPGDPPPTSPAALARVVRARLEGDLPPPVVSSSPPAGVAAIIGFPSFVSVENWSGAVSDSECDPSVPSFCVTVVAEPSLTWLPGEPGVDPVPCAGSGTRFDPTAGAPEAQAAAEGACAHAYRLRTGVVGRPGEWPGVAIVSWELVYVSPEGGGALPAVVKSAPVPRAVDEAQTVVESAG